MRVKQSAHFNLGRRCAETAAVLAVLAIEYLARQLIFSFYPLGSVGSPLGPMLNLVLFLISVIGLALSLWYRRGIQD